jgi:hypothetical protein
MTSHQKMTGSRCGRTGDKKIKKIKTPVVQKISSLCCAFPKRNPASSP